MTEAPKSYQRFSLAQRIEHVVLLLSFTLLGLTGLPQKYPLSPISKGVVDFLGGIETIRVIHRVSAAIFLLEAVYHLVMIGYKLYVQRREASMIPTIKDAKDAIQAAGYNLGLHNRRPKLPRYNFTEKAEYWAMIWGLLIMAITGFMLWNPIATTNLLPGDFIPAARAAHGGEAVLAVLAIILWHFYHVHLRIFNKSMFTGKLDRETMEEEHGEELERLEASAIPPLPPPEVTRRRMMVYVPVAAVTSLALAAGLYYFMTFEDTAITTIPPAEQATAFLPQTPTPFPTATQTPTLEPTATPTPTRTPRPNQPTPTTAPTVVSAVAWEGDVQQLFADKCVSCHGSTGGFSAESYVDVLEDIVPGDPDASRVVAAQKDGNHPGQFSADELATVVVWIEAGAPEQAGQEGAGGREPVNPVTFTGLQETLQNKCGACHGSSGGFSVASYEDVMEAIQPGDAEGSRLVQVMQAGDHPGELSDPELEQVIQWIEVGAPEQ